MGDVLGYARVSTGDQDVAGQTMRLEQAGAIRVFTDVRSGKSLDRPGLTELLAYNSIIFAIASPFSYWFVAKPRLSRRAIHAASVICYGAEIKTFGTAIFAQKTRVLRSRQPGMVTGGCGLSPPRYFGFSRL